MNLTVSSPPQLTGDADIDTKNINEWCYMLHNHLKRIFFSNDDSIALVNENITSINDTLTGINGSIAAINERITALETASEESE